MYCRKCGKEIIEGKICKNCGFDQEQMKYVNVSNNNKANISGKVRTDLNTNNHSITKSKKKNKSKGNGLRIGLIVITILLCVGVGIYGYMYFFGSIKVKRQSEKLLNLIDERQFSEALDFYEKKMKGSHGAELIDNFPDKMEKKYESILDEYNNGKLDDGQVDALMSLLESIPLTDPVYFEFYNRYSELYSSKRNYTSALKAIEEKKYEEAVNYLMKVSNADLNYTDAKEKLKDTIVNMINETDNYANAFNMLEHYSDKFSQEEYESMKQNITDAIINAADEKVKAYLNSGKYDEAKEYLSALAKTYPDISVLSQKLSSLESVYIQNVKLTAQKYFDEKDYGKAASTIKMALAQVGDENTELMELYQEYKSYLGIYIDELVTLRYSKDLCKGQNVKDNTGKTHIHSFSFGGSVEYLLDGKYSLFSGTIALPMSNKNTLEEYYYKIYGDEQLLYTSDKFTAGSLPADFSIDISNVKVMKIEIVDIRYLSGFSFAGDSGELIIYDGILNRNIQ